MAPFIAVGRNTFSEIIRQPFYAGVVLTSLLGYALSPSFAMFTLGEDASLLADFGVSAVFFAGLLLAAFGVPAVAGRERERKTLDLLLSKPVGREAVLLGKLAGVLAALAAAWLLFTAALLLAARQGPPLTAAQRLDWPAAAAGWGALLLTFTAAGLTAARRARALGVLTVRYGLAFYALGLVVAGFLAPDGHPQPFGRGFDPALFAALVLALFGVAVVAVTAVVLSLLLRRGAALATLVLFVAGLTVGGDSFLLLPDLQLFWAGELFYQPAPALSALYVGKGALYAGLYGGAWTCAGAWLLGRSEA